MSILLVELERLMKNGDIKPAVFINSSVTYVSSFVHIQQ